MISIIVPTYNEKESIRLLFDRISKVMKEEFELIFVDDSSPDGTADEARKLSKKFSNVKLVSRKGKYGLSGAVFAGFRESKGEIILIMDADLSHPPEVIPQLLSNLPKYDIAIGSRLIKGGGVENWPIHRKLISIGADIISRCVIGSAVTDPMSGFFAAKRSIFEKTRLRTKGYKILLNILADNPDIKIIEVPYIFTDRIFGKTKLDFSEKLRYISDVLRIRWG